MHHHQARNDGLASEIDDGGPVGWRNAVAVSQSCNVPPLDDDRLPLSWRGARPVNDPRVDEGDNGSVDLDETQDGIAQRGIGCCGRPRRRRLIGRRQKREPESKKRQTPHAREL